jgi:sialic acid synthase SpsE
MEAGETFTTENLRIIRPGSGLPPKFYHTILGKTAKHALKKGTPVSWDILG